MHLIMLFSEDRGFVEKLFDPSVEFVSNLIHQDLKSRRYIKKFLDFIDPFTQNSNIRSILRNALGVKSLKLNIRKAERNVDFVMMETMTLNKCSSSTMNKDPSLKLSTINLFRELQLDVKNGMVEVDLMGLARLMSNCYQMDQNAILLLYQVFLKIFDDEPVYKNILRLLQKLIIKDKLAIFDSLPGVVALLIANLRRVEGKELSEKDGLLIQLISKWMHGVAIMLDKENLFQMPGFGPGNNGGSNVVMTVFTDAVKATLDYFGDAPLQANAFTEHKDNILFVIDVLVGILSICKMNFAGLKPLALKVGGFPNMQKLTAFFDIIKKNKAHIGLTDMAHLKMPAAPTTDPNSANNQAITSNPQLGLDPRVIYAHFAAKNKG